MSTIQALEWRGRAEEITRRQSELRRLQSRYEQERADALAEGHGRGVSTAEQALLAEQHALSQERMALLLQVEKRRGLLRLHQSGFDRARGASRTAASAEEQLVRAELSLLEATRVFLNGTAERDRDHQAALDGQDPARPGRHRRAGAPTRERPRG
ncbi:hypothetical protein ACEZCY_30965 [Streptacidiphilus sp. N1-12]|uniref:Flagellar FliJ protein n=2 Tax=Streptacidiphilus alkalitolerans TaxID=3342712 RepID=A0ABV6WNP0_9ACTN